jgi:hypothetical protein
MSDAPERIWVQWPQPNGTGLAFNTDANPRNKADDRFNKRTAYVRADLLEAAQTEIAALRERAEKAGRQRNDEFGRRIEAELLRDAALARVAELEGLLKKAEGGLFWAQSHLRDKGLTSMNVDAALAETRAALASGQEGGE